MAAADKSSELIAQFMAVTGCADEAVAKNTLDVCSSNLEMAINMFLEGGHEMLDAGSSVSRQEDEVRAPIPHKHETLVEHENVTFDFKGKARKRGAASVFDTFRDFQEETRLQEEDVKRNGIVIGIPGVSVSKRRTLEELFRPPFDIMYRGSFQSAKDIAEFKNRWLLVNIQVVNEFSCQVLNRDVWSNPVVKEIVKEHFIFWQVNEHSIRGQQYKTLYPIEKFPYVSIIEPVTGECLTVWNSLDVASFCELSSSFILRHPDRPRHPATTRPEKKIRTHTIADADEEAQLAIAIKASLATSNPQPPSSDESELESFSDSESRDAAVPVHSSEPSLKDGSGVSVDLSSTIKKSSDPRPTSKGNPASVKASNGESNAGECYSVADSSLRTISGELRVDESDKVGVEEEKKMEDEEWKKYLGSSEDPPSRLVLRYPSPLNSREHVVFPCSSTLMALFKFVESKGFSEGEYELRTSFPTRIFTSADASKTMKELGLFPQETVFVNSKV